MERIIFLDRMSLNKYVKNSAVLFSRLPEDIFVCTESIIDSMLVVYPEFVIQGFAEGWLRCEVWSSLDKMFEKPFYWSSLNCSTPATTSAEECIKQLSVTAEYKHSLENFVNLIDKFGIPKEKWLSGSNGGYPFSNLMEEALKDLGCPPSSNRTAALSAATTPSAKQIFMVFNEMYVWTLAMQHHCTHYLNTEGTIMPIIPII